VLTRVSETEADVFRCRSVFVNDTSPYCVVFTCAASRAWGHEAKQRPHSDTEARLVLIADPTQTALSDGTIRGWQLYANVVDIQYSVYLQV